MVNPVPELPKIVPSNSQEGIKIATPDIILFDEDSVPIEVMTDLIFENIGGQELINIARNDIVNGQSVIYSPIKNLSNVYFQYNPQNILALQATSSSFFKKFPIKFENKVPNIGTGPNGQIVYIDPETGDIVINVINLEEDEQVEVQMLSSGEIFNDTIYGGNL
jgi:hypothetical protein